MARSRPDPRSASRPSHDAAPPPIFWCDVTTLRRQYRRGQRVRRCLSAGLGTVLVGLVVGAAVLLFARGEGGQVEEVQTSPVAATSSEAAVPAWFAALTGELGVTLEPYLMHSPGRVAVAVYFPESGQQYTWWGEERFPAHSTIKLALLGGALYRAHQAGRFLTDEERARLQPMVTWSDNDATDALYQGLGPYTLQAYLDHLHLTDISLRTDGQWGHSLVSAAALARLMDAIATCAGLSQADCAYANALLTQVVPQDFWGIPTALPDGIVVGFKNGWYPDEDNGVWRVHSVANIQAEQRLVLAVLTEYPITLGYRYGVTMTETVAALVWQAITYVRWPQGAE